MLREIKTMEAKIRRPESLLDHELIYRHFDRKLPATIHSAQGLERWLHKSKTDLFIKLKETFPASQR